MIEPVDVFWKCNKGYLGVTHPLPNGDILIANVGDPAGNAKGEFSCQHSHSPAEIPISGVPSETREPGFVTAASLVCPRWLRGAGRRDL